MRLDRRLQHEGRARRSPARRLAARRVPHPRRRARAEPRGSPERRFCRASRWRMAWLAASGRPNCRRSVTCVTARSRRCSAAPRMSAARSSLASSATAAQAAASSMTAAVAPATSISYSGTERSMPGPGRQASAAPGSSAAPSPAWASSQSAPRPSARGRPWRRYPPRRCCPAPCRRRAPPRRPAPCRQDVGSAVASPTTGRQVASTGGLQQR